MVHNTDQVSILSTLQSIFAEELDQPNIILTLSDDQDSVMDWDSLAHIRIMAAIESHYDFQFELSELEDLKSVDVIIAAISAKLS